MVMVSGCIQTKQLMKVSGWYKKAMVKELKLGHGYIYKGEFKNSEWSGIGILSLPDGSTYEGEWTKGL